VTATTSPRLLELLDDAQLVRRGDAGVDVLGRQVEGLRDRPRGDGMVSGEHLHPEAGAPGFAQSPRCGRPERIVERHEAEQLELALDLVGGMLDHVRKPPLGDGEDTQALAGPGRGGDLGARPLCIVSRGALEHDLGRAFRHRAKPLRLALHDRHPLPIGVERKLGGDRPGLEEIARADAVLAGRLEECRLDRIRGDPVVPALGELGRRGEHSRLEEFACRRALERGDGGDAERVLGERPCLVRADDRGLAGGLDGREPPDDGAAGGHRMRAERERDRHRRGQAFRHGGDGDRNSDEERLLERRAPQQHPGREYERDDDPQHDHEAREAGQPRLERGRRAFHLFS
jgi:hypothetical protein